MQYTIPQFIEAEDKIIGPLTLKQFLYLLGGAIFIFMIWYFADLQLFLFLSIPLGAFFLALAFYKVNDRPFIYFLMSAARYVARPKVRIWNRNVSLPEIKTKYNIKDKRSEKKEKIIEKSKISKSSLEKLAYILDTQGTINQISLPRRQAGKIKNQNEK